MDAALYKNIFENNLVPFVKNKMGVDWIFQRDNDLKHISKLVKIWLESQNIRVLKWPAQSPDLNPIERICEELKKRVGHLTHSSKDTLFHNLLREWNAIPSDVLVKLIDSMPRRYSAVIEARGRTTRY